MKMKGVFGAIVVLMSLGLQAQAETWDFQAAVIAEGEQAFVDAFPGGMTEGAITLTTSADDLNTGAADDAYAYLDANVGLGVCKVIDGDSQCDPASDDNLQFDESLTLSFSQSVTITGFVMSEEGHGFAAPGEDFYIEWLDGITAMTQVLVIGINGIVSGLSLSGSDFQIFATYEGDNTPREQFYITSVTAVPEPAALMLMGLGLLGLVFARRRSTLNI